MSNHLLNGAVESNGTIFQFDDSTTFSPYTHRVSSPDSNSHQPVLDDSEKLSKILLTNHNNSSPTSASSSSSLLSNPMSSIRFLTDSSINTQISSSSPTHSIFSTDNYAIQPVKQIHQGLLYNLLIAKESSFNDPSLATTKNSTGATQSSISVKILNGNHHSPIRSLVVPNCTRSSSKANSLYSNFRHRANSISYKLSTTKPYIRQYASSVGGVPNFYPSLKTRSKNRRQTKLSIPVPVFCKPKISSNHRSYSKSHDNSMNLALTHSYTHLNSSILHTSSLSPSGISSPHTHQHNACPLAKLTAPSSGFCSANGLHQSPLTSSLSTDSGSDEPIDLTGYVWTTSPTVASQTIFPKQVCDNLNRTNLALSPNVQLAKKTARPVQARITEWLKQATEFVALSTPLVTTLKPALSFANGSKEDLGSIFEKDNISIWISLLGQCWYKLLALSMVENALDLVVVEDKSSYDTKYGSQQHHQDLGQLGIPWLLLPDVQHYGLAAAYSKNRRPDRKFTNELLQFLSEIRQAGLTSQEFYLIRYVILLTADEPDNTPNLGLNVIRASRCMDYQSERKMTVVNLLKNGSQTSDLANNSVKDINSPQFVSFDLACLACGLKALSSMCPYRIANLFCGHLQCGSHLNHLFILDMHVKYLSALKDLQRLSTSQLNFDISNTNLNINNNKNNTNNDNNDGNNYNSTIIVNNNGNNYDDNFHNNVYHHHTTNKHSEISKLQVNRKSILEQLFDNA